MFVMSPQRRELPSLPKLEEITPRGRRDGEPREGDQLHEDFSYHMYNYITDADGLQGARRKHPLHSLSTVRLDEKQTDRMRLLDNVRENSYNGDLNAGNVVGARGLNTNSQEETSLRRGDARGFDEQVEVLANAFENSTLATPQQTHHPIRGWQSSSPLHPGRRGAFTPNSGRRDDQRSLSHDDCWN